MEAKNKLNFDSFAKYPNFFFRLVSFDFNELQKDATQRQRCLYGIKKYYLKFCSAAAMFGLISIFVGLIKNLGDFVNASSYFLDFFTMIIFVVKIFIPQLRRNDIRSIIQEFKEIFEKHGENIKEQEIESHRNRYYFYVKITTGWTFMGLASSTLNIIVPFIINGAMNLTIKYWFPFDIYRPEMFPIAIGWTCWLAWIVLLSGHAYDLLLYAFLTLLAMEFDNLKNDIKNLCGEPEQEGMKRIKSLIDQHNKLLNLSGKLQKLFSVSLFLSFVITSIIMCFIMFLLVIFRANGDYSLYGHYITYLTVMGGQTLLLCYFGQKLIDASESVSGEVYCSGWEKSHDKDQKRYLALIISRAQRPNKLTAMGFADISLETFTKVIN